MVEIKREKAKGTALRRGHWKAEGEREGGSNRTQQLVLGYSEKNNGLLHGSFQPSLQDEDGKDD